MIYLSPHTPSLFSAPSQPASERLASANATPDAPVVRGRCAAGAAKGREQLCSALHLPVRPRGAMSPYALGQAPLTTSRVVRSLAQEPVQAPAPQRGDVVHGTVRAVRAFGAFVEIAPGVEGLLHVSKLFGGRQADAHEIFQHIQVGQPITVTVESADPVRHRYLLAPQQPITA